MGLVKNQIEQTDKGLLPKDVNKANDLQANGATGSVTNESFAKVPTASIGDFKTAGSVTWGKAKIQGSEPIRG